MEGWNKPSSGGSTYTHPATHPANIITVADEDNHFTSTNVEEVLKELFTSGNSGKILIETAVISKGGTVSKAGTIATFSELDAGIQSIGAPMRYASGTVNSQSQGSGYFYTNETGTYLTGLGKVVVTGLTFQPKLIRIYKGTAVNPSSFYTWGNYQKNIIGNYNYMSGMEDPSSDLTVIVQHKTTGVPYNQGSNLAIVTATGFTLPVKESYGQYTWEVWG